MAGVSISEPIASLRSRYAEPGGFAWWFTRERLAVAGAILIILAVAAAVLAPVLTPYPAEGRGTPNIVNKLLPPSWSHPFGTGPLGRDLLARVLFGARTAFIAAVSIQVSGATVGALLGALAGYFGDWLDEAIMRVTDIFLAFPPLLLAMTVAAVLEPSLRNSIIAITLTWWPWYARLARNEALSVRERDYVRAARATGVRDTTIIFRHILPNILTPILVQATLDIGAAIMTISTLSFVGLGVPPPRADWGTMIRDGRIHLQAGRWWVPTFPGLALFLTIMSFNLVGDRIQVAMNPRLRGRLK